MSAKHSARFSIYEFLLKTQANFPVLFFNFSFYLAFCPFKFKKNEDGLYSVHKSIIQQVFCSFVSTSSLFHRFTETRMNWPEAEGNPVEYFALFFNSCNFFFNVVVWYMLWFKNDKFLFLVRFLHSKESIPNTKLRVNATVGGGVIYISSTIIALICFLLGTDILQKSHWNPKLLLKCFSNHAKYMLFITDHHDRISELGELTLLDVLIASLYGASHFFRRIVGFYENMLTAVGPFTLWIATSEFITSLTSSVPGGRFPQRWSIVSRRYNDLRKLTDIVNDAFGPLFISHFLTGFFFYSCNLDKFINATDGFIRLKFFAYYFIYVLTLLVASDVCRQMSYLEPWISVNLKEDALGDLTHKELTLILHELEVNRIGISGCGVLTMTYSLSAQVAGAIITYFIISLQYRTQDTL